MTDELDSRILTHYYGLKEKPFQSLSALSEENALKVIKSYDLEDALVYKRFKNPLTYLDERRQTESWLRESLVNKEGRPEKEFPYYLVLGASSYIFDGYNGECLSVKVPISNLDDTQISFTYSDSMVSYWLSKNKKNETFYNSNIHGHVFTYNEILAVLSKFPFSDKMWERKKSESYNFFIEAQVWSDDILKFT